MVRRSEILSVAVSAAVVVLLATRLLPEDRPVPVARPATPPEPAVAAERETPASVPLAAIVLPPPRTPAPKPAAEAVFEAAPEAPFDPVEVRPLRPATAEPGPAAEVGPAPGIALKPLRPAPVPAPAPRGISAPEQATKPVPGPRTEPAKSPEETAATVGAVDPRPVLAAGRPLLRLFEHGDGPAIDIAWPAAAADRDALFATFERCYGMLVALMAPDGSLYSERAEKAPWRIDLDRYSGFVRQSGGLLASAERRWARRISARHPLASGAAPVRIFPRGTDALLMGGLDRLLDGGYRATESIRAHYRRHGDAVFIEGIVADGRAVPGRVALGAAAGRRCAVDRGRSGI